MKEEGLVWEGEAVKIQLLVRVVFGCDGRRSLSTPTTWHLIYSSHEPNI